MRLSLLKILRSPVSYKPLKIDIFEEGIIGDGKSQILSGRIYTDDGEEYPVINGVPRMLTGNLLNKAVARYPEFIEKYGLKFNSIKVTGITEDLKLETMESFGIQWNMFPDILNEWKRNFQEYLAPITKPEDLKGKLVLDCGCGFGRHLYQTAASNANMAVGVDLSHAVDAAVKNVAIFENAHVIQGDIYNLPVADVFEFVYSLGVLQHLPDPAQGFVSISSKVKSGGRMLVWMYNKRPTTYHLLIDNLRHITVGMKPATLYSLSRILAILSFGLLALPRRAFESLGCKRLGSAIPYSSYAKYPFQVSHADWYDRLAAPKTAYLTKDEAWDMLKQAKLHNTSVVPRMKSSGWIATGKR